MGVKALGELTLLFKCRQPMCWWSIYFCTCWILNISISRRVQMLIHFYHITVCVCACIYIHMHVFMCKNECMPPHPCGHYTITWEGWPLLYIHHVRSWVLNLCHLLWLQMPYPPKLSFQAHKCQILWLSLSWDRLLKMTEGYWQRVKEILQPLSGNISWLRKSTVLHWDSSFS